MTLDTKVSGQNGGRHTPWWPLVFSGAIHLMLLLLPLPRGQSIGRSHDLPISSLGLPPLIVEFRVESGSTVPTIVLGKLAGDDPPVETVPAAAATKGGGQDVSPSPPSGNIVASDSLGYLPPERLTHLPEIRDLGNLDLPGVVRPGDSGRLILEILISDEGHPDAIRIVETSVPAPFLANAMRVFQWARYEPGRELNRAVRSRIRVEIILGEQPSDARSTVLPRGGTNHKLEQLYVLPR